MIQSGSEFSPEHREAVLSALSMLQWTSSTPLDRLAEYKASRIRSTKVTTAGPTSASDQVLMQGRLTASKEATPMIQGRATHRLSWVGKRLMKELPPLQITHRSRPASLMSNRLQLNELNRRVDKARANMKTLTSISLPPNIAEELLSIKASALKKHLKLDMETIAKYVKEHKKSSIIPGLKWDQLDETDRPFWSKYFDVIRGYADEHYFNGENFNSKFNFGARQRNDDLVYPDETHYDLEVHRTRVVMFTPGLSSVFAFVPDKIGFYRDVIEGALDVLDINDHVMTPMTHGGEVYGAASEAMKGNEDVTIVLGDDCNIYRNGEQYCYDGVNWETQVGTILGEPFHGTKAYFGGMYHVPSGVFDTSLDDTLATLWCYSNLEEMKSGKDITGIMERSKLDEEVGFMLGMAYKEDPDYPRLQGLKLTVDKSDKSVPLPTGRNLEIFGKQTEDEKERWYLGYHGARPDGGSLLDFLQDVSPEDFRGGEVAQWIESGFPNED